MPVSWNHITTNQEFVLDVSHTIALRWHYVSVQKHMLSDIYEKIGKKTV
jgi:hypothetical protein